MLVTYNHGRKTIKNAYGKVSNARAHPELCIRNLIIGILIRFIQGFNNTYYCGSYTTPGNGHDLSLLSGFAVARAIGAEYPFIPEDREAKRDFEKLCRLMGIV
eukprot:TRINITY_DN16646_c0_g1_i1.p1 TRINITY_DN16646_c0_g1~~TRINITY_DN16646_c0_g1_i1.p1  ORF type:complete len:117 (-),score=0.32 TRINITY_DN16646_c0_g1_i1:4-312(-)